MNVSEYIRAIIKQPGLFINKAAFLEKTWHMPELCHEQRSRTSLSSLVKAFVRPKKDVMFLIFWQIGQNICRLYFFFFFFHMMKRKKNKSATDPGQSWFLYTFVSLICHWFSDIFGLHRLFIYFQYGCAFTSQTEHISAVYINFGSM